MSFDIRTWNVRVYQFHHLSINSNVSTPAKAGFSISQSISIATLINWCDLGTISPPQHDCNIIFLLWITIFFTNLAIFFTIPIYIMLTEKNKKSNGIYIITKYKNEREKVFMRAYGIRRRKNSICWLFKEKRC